MKLQEEFLLVHMFYQLATMMRITDKLKKSEDLLRMILKEF